MEGKEKEERLQKLTSMVAFFFVILQEMVLKSGFYGMTNEIMSSVTSL